MPDSISGHKWEVSKYLRFFLRGVDIMLDNNCR